MSKLNALELSALLKNLYDYDNNLVMHVSDNWFKVTLDVPLRLIDSFFKEHKDLSFIMVGDSRSLQEGDCYKYRFTINIL